jgi:hypothetical protein
MEVIMLVQHTRTTFFGILFGTAATIMSIAPLYAMEETEGHLAAASASPAHNGAELVTRDRSTALARPLQLSDLSHIVQNMSESKALPDNAQRALCDVSARLEELSHTPITPAFAPLFEAQIATLEMSLVGTLCTGEAFARCREAITTNVSKLRGDVSRLTEELATTREEMKAQLRERIIALLTTEKSFLADTCILSIDRALTTIADLEAHQEALLRSQATMCFIMVSALLFASNCCSGCLGHGCFNALICLLALMIERTLYYCCRPLWTLLVHCCSTLCKATTKHTSSEELKKALTLLKTIISQTISDLTCNIEQ